MSLDAVAEGELLWQPSEPFKAHSRMAAYMRWVAERHSLRFETYDDLWRWSVDHLEAFWASIADFFGVEFAAPPRTILADAG
ncbi:MAG: acetoacetate--CoA ligase, partial [Chloroflexi bacterium]|nr:acetoacetate--CoA ligase [Chloroflexota bacterium]